jgi:xanthine dehydrogenase accessory factor
MRVQADEIRATGATWLRPLQRNWPRAVCQLLEQGEPAVVRIVIANVLGSAPREPGACMLVSGAGTRGTIGGGNLEWQAVRAGRAISIQDTGPASPSVRVRRLVLGRELGQCCGGVVQLWLERFTRADLPFLERASQVITRGCDPTLVTELSGASVTRRLTQSQQRGVPVRFAAADDQHATLIERIESAAPAVWLYGAGHVGQALIRVLGELPFEITWIDSRSELLPNELPENVHPLCAPDPIATTTSAPADARYLVMTHDHSLDYALCRAILSRGDFAWLGLIGSRSKGARFRSRLARDGVPAEAVARLTSPIGMDGIDSKLPAAIAIGVAAQLLQLGRPTADVHSRRVSASDGGCSSHDCAHCRGTTHG